MPASRLHLSDQVGAYMYVDEYTFASSGMWVGCHADHARTGLALSLWELHSGQLSVWQT